MFLQGSWRIPMWSGAAALLALPAIAMQFSKEISWGLEDFLIVGILLAAVCGTVELASRVSTNGLYQAGVALAAAGGFSLVFINLAVGIIGDEQDPRNLVFMAIPVVGFLGALIARFKAAVLVRLLVGMAAVQFFAMFLAPADLMSLMIPFTGIFVGLWLVCALLIRRSTRA
jgi:hypothetical protein